MAAQVTIDIFVQGYKRVHVRAKGDCTMESLVGEAGFNMCDIVLLHQWDRLRPRETLADVCVKAGEISPLLQLYEQQCGGKQQLLWLKLAKAA